MFASKTVCEQVGKIQQRESDKINRGRRDGRGPVFQDGHSMSYECLSQKDYYSGLDTYEPKPPEPDLNTDKGGAPTVQTKGSTLVCPGSRWRYVVTDAGVEHHSLPSTPPLSPYVRGDGYYKYHDLATVWYLRFYSDGTVVMDERLDPSSFPTADTLNKTWCRGIGIFETDDHLIKFQLRIGDALVPLDFNGQAWSNELNFPDQHYTFVPWER
jgi:hypothetical protein